MTAAKAAALRADKVRGSVLPNVGRREEERVAKEAAKAKEEAEQAKWTIGKLWLEYVNYRYGGKAVLSDKSYYKTHLKDTFGEKEPQELAPLDVDRLRIRMMKTLSPGTAAKTLGLLVRLINFGVEKQLCHGASFRIKLPRVNNEKTESMTDEQMTTYIKTAHEWPDTQAGAYVLLQLFTGMRRSEARKLKWEDVDLGRGFLTIRNPKGGKDQRIPLNAAASDILQNLARAENNPFVFAGAKGKPRVSIYLDQASRAIRDAAGLPKDFRPNHGLRHSFASHLANSGEVDLYTIQRLLTHKNPSMTQRYAHLRDEALKRGSDVMARIVNQVASAEGGNG